MILAPFYKALHTRCGFEPVAYPEDKDLSTGRARILARVPANGVRQWMFIAHALLLASETSPQWKADISKQLFLRESPSGKKLFYGWRIVLQASSIADCVQDLTRTVGSAPRPKVQIEEYPLPGGSASRNSGGDYGGRGAARIKER